MARGGRRGGNKGGGYTNRTDLNAPKLPVTAPTGQPYGDRQALQNAQRAVPMGPAPKPGATPPSSPPPNAPIPGQLGGFGTLTAPTQRPNEPVTAGLPQGPGPGPEVLQNLNQTTGQLSSMLNQVSQESNSAVLSQLANRAQAAGQ